MRRCHSRSIDEVNERLLTNFTFVKVFLLSLIGEEHTTEILESSNDDNQASRCCKLTPDYFTTP